MKRFHPQNSCSHPGNILLFLGIPITPTSTKYNNFLYMESSIIFHITSSGFKAPIHRRFVAGRSEHSLRPDGWPASVKIPVFPDVLLLISATRELPDGDRTVWKTALPDLFRLNYIFSMADPTPPSQ